jgi:adenylate kinase family enzyme
MKKSVIILRGLPGSGKTTFLGLLLPYIHISMDLFWTKDGQPYAFDYSKLQEAIGWTHDQFRQALDAEGNITVVVDNVSYAHDHYRFFKEYAEEQGHTVHVVHIERPIPECIDSTTHNVPREKILQMAKNWQPINDPEEL